MSVVLITSLLHCITTGRVNDNDNDSFSLGLFRRQHKREQQVQNNSFKVQWCQIVIFKSVQCHPGLIYIFIFSHSDTLALRAERQSARMSEIKNVG